MKRVSVMTIALLAVLCVCLVLRANEQQADSKQSVMEQKLSHAQGILNGLARQDFESLSGQSAALLALARQQWIEHDTPEYRAQLKDFWISLEGINASAKEENLDGATLGYMQLTLSCVKCHKYLRSMQQVE